MSKYKVLALTINDEHALIEALGRVGIAFQDHRANPIAFQDWARVTQPEKASFFITKDAIAGLPDLKQEETWNHYAGVALIKGADGMYSAVLDETHGRSSATVFMERLNKQYGRAKAVGLAKSRGYSVESESEEADGSLRLRLVKR